MQKIQKKKKPADFHQFWSKEVHSKKHPKINKTLMFE
jgi:cephalosporin-C deacetylase-like acetyl esterase